MVRQRGCKFMRKVILRGLINLKLQKLGTCEDNKNEYVAQMS
jgi:hypothetical protein